MPYATGLREIRFRVKGSDKLCSKLFKNSFQPASAKSFKQRSLLEKRFVSHTISKMCGEKLLDSPSSLHMQMSPLEVGCRAQTHCFPGAKSSHSGFSFQTTLRKRNKPIFLNSILHTSVIKQTQTHSLGQETHFAHSFNKSIHF